MKTSHVLIAFAGFLTLCAALATPVYMRGEFATHAVSENSPPSAFPDHYTLHRSFETPLEFPRTGVLKNDSDPDNDPLTCIFTQVTTSLGTAFVFSSGKAAFEPAYGQTGSVTIPYTVCDNHEACASSTVTFEVTNAPPVANSDSYVVHGSFETPLINPPPYGILKNDSDPEGDPITAQSKRVDTALGTAFIGTNGKASFVPNSGQTGEVSITYTACDDLGACADGSVTFQIVNQGPVAVDDLYVVRRDSFETPLTPQPSGVLKNDYDPENDPLQVFSVRTDFPQGTAFVGGNARAIFVRNPNYPDVASYSGTFSIAYPLCDNLGACSQGTVTFFVIGDGEDDGAMSCNTRVGRPVNVTTGNVFLQQSDYLLPGTGPAIDITRAYNSNSQTTGLFGRGWTTVYDESINVYDASLVGLKEADGRATYLGRATNSAGVFSPLEGDMHGALAENGAGFTLTMKDGSVRQFNGAGKLLSIADRNGNQTTLSYEADGKLISVMDRFGRVLSFATNSNGQVLAIADSMGTIATYTYGAAGQLLSVTYADSSTFQFNYDNSLRLNTVSDALGNIVESHVYDSQGRATTSEIQGSVEHYSLNYVSATQTEVTDALGHVTKYTFDTGKGRNVVTNVEGLCSCGGSQVQSWTYDEALNVTSHTNALTQTATYTYDGNGNRISATGVLGSSTFTYNRFGQVLTATDAMGGTTTNTYDDAGNLLSTKDPLDNPTTFTYDQRGELLTMTNALGRVTALAYDARGNISRATDAAGNITNFVYDGRGRLTNSTNALGFTTSYAYDSAGRLNKIVRPDQSFVTFTYDLAGRRIKVTDALNNSTTFTYDGAYHLTGLTDPLGKSVSFGYDLMSNLNAITDQLARTTNIAYDDFNRPVRTTYPPATVGAARLQETIEYDVVGNVTKRTDSAGRVTSFAYDNGNRLLTFTDPAGQITQYEYNPRSNVTAVVDALGQRYSFVYDALGRVTAATRAGTTMTIAYDALGNRSRRTDFNNLTTVYNYDALNRLTRISYPDASAATYGYDKLSRLTAATNENGTVSFVYDSLGRIISTSDVFGQVLNYAYDANDRRTKLSFGAITNATYTYDALDRLTKITDSANDSVAYNYDAARELTSRTLPNGVITTYSYDGLDRLTSLRDAKKNTVIADNNYQYNTAGNITQNIDQSGTHVYGYDALDRLASAGYTGTPNETYAYDGVGNRTSSDKSPTYGYEAFNRLVSTSTAGYVYNNNGNMISKTAGTATTQYAWDFENRLTQVVTPSSGSVTYKYDALGRRIQRIASNGLATNFIYDGQDIVKDLNSDGTSVEYLNGPGVDNKIRQAGPSNKTTYYFSQDHLGSTTALSGTTGKLIERLTYDAYGNSNGSAATRYGFTGRERDQLTGLLYYRARYYDPQLGRFISEDPIGLSGGINQFAYVGDDPQNAIDPSGLYEIDVHYYLTYYLALKTGCFTTHEARLIADADQSTDENPDTEPWYGWNEKHRRTNSDNHAFNPGNEGNLSNLRQAAGPRNYVAIGRYLHYLQDTFSHRGFYNAKYGQLGFNGVDLPILGGFVVDNTNHDVMKAEDMARATFFALYELGQGKGCDCKFPGIDSWWGTVMDFLKANNDDLGTKQSILDVPLR